MKNLITICVFLVVAVVVPQVKADTFDFEIFNNAVYMGIGDLGISVDVTDKGFEPFSGNSLVSFVFTNDVVIDSSITHVYFDDGSLLGISSIATSAGVEFAQGASPAELPGASILDPDFETTQDFNADADSNPDGKAPNGVDEAGEWLEIVFELKPGETFADVITQLNADAAVADESLRIGLKIQSLPDGDSAAAVHTPEPATIFLLGISGLVLRRRKQR